MPFLLHIIYHTEDERLLRLFESYLKLYKRNDLLQTWHSGLIIGGLNIAETIQTQLDKADGIVVLCSIDLFNDDVTYLHLTQAIRQYQQYDKLIIPILLRPFDWELTPLKSLALLLPRNQQPIVTNEQHDIEEAFVEVIKDLWQLIQQHQPGSKQVDINPDENIQTGRINFLSHEVFKPFLAQEHVHTQKVFALAYPFSQVFLEAITTPKYVKQLQTTQIIRESEKMWYLEYTLSEYFRQEFIISSEQLSNLVQKCTDLLATKQYEDIDLLNIFHLLLVFYDKKPYKSIKDEIINAFLTINFRMVHDPLSVTKIINLFLSHIDSFHLVPHQRVAAMNNCVSGLDTIGQYDEALGYIQTNLAFSKQQLDDNHPETIRAYEILANLYYEMGNFEASIKAYISALSRLEQTTDANDIRRAALYQNIARPYHQLGGRKLQRVIVLYEKALRICQAQVGNDNYVDRLISNILGNLGVVYETIGMYDKALKYSHEAIEAKEKLLGLEHPSVALSYNNLANIYLQVGKNELALQNAQKALSIRLKKLGSEHPYTLITERNIASIYIQSYEFDKAQAILDRLIITYDKAHKMTDYFTVVDEYIEIYILLKDYDGALICLQHRATERKNTYGDKYHKNAQHCFNIGYVLYKKGQYHDALQQYNQIITILNEDSQSYQLDIAKAHVLKGKILLQQQQSDQALEYIEKALSIYHEKLGDQHVSIAAIYGKKAQIYLLNKSYDQALSESQKALDVYLSLKNQVQIAEAIAYVLSNCAQFKPIQAPEWNKYIDLLSKIEDPYAHNRAVEILQKAQVFANIDTKTLLKHLKNKDFFKRLLDNIGNTLPTDTGIHKSSGIINNSSFSEQLNNLLSL